MTKHISYRRAKSSALYDPHNPPLVPEANTALFKTLEYLLDGHRIVVLDPPCSPEEVEIQCHITSLTNHGWILERLGVGVARNRSCYYEVRLLGTCDALLAHVRQNSLNRRESA